MKVTLVNNKLIDFITNFCKRFIWSQSPILFRNVNSKALNFFKRRCSSFTSFFLIFPINNETLSCD